MKKIPYGLSDFVAIQTENMYFVDKTKYIAKLEDAGNYLMFLRPRRFGKSLYLAILDAYYSIEYKDQFDILFKDTYIGANPTKEANSYYSLKFDFSSVSLEDVEYSFTNTVELKVNSFIKRYKLPIEIKKHPKETLKNIMDYFVEHQDKKLYILIDEYDHFANRLLLENFQGYKNTVSTKTAFYKEFFTILKSGAGGNHAPIKRMFITGVTPMIMSDVTSGFNIVENISINSNFNEMVGFNEQEVKELLTHYKVPLTLMPLLKEWYNNYLFSKQAKNEVFNSDMVFYFVKQYKIVNQLPDNLIDDNVRANYSTLRNIIYTNKKLNGNFETLKTLIGGDSIKLREIKSDFGGLEFTNEDNFKSLLFYLGLVTIDKGGINTLLKIPNETIKRIDIEFLKDSLELEQAFNLNINTLGDLLEEFALKGDIEAFKYLANQIKNNTSLRDYINNEQTIKSMFLAYLSLISYYTIKSELELNKGFADIFVKPLNPYVKYFALIEFKFYRKKDKTSNTIDNLIQKATEQLNKYEQDELVTEHIKNNKILVKLILIFEDYELVEIKEV